MKLKDKIMQMSGETEEQLNIEHNCPLNYYYKENEEYKVDFTCMCVEDGEYCEECWNQEVNEEISKEDKMELTTEEKRVIITALAYLPANIRIGKMSYEKTKRMINRLFIRVGGYQDTLGG